MTQCELDVNGVFSAGIETSAVLGGRYCGAVRRRDLRASDEDASKRRVEISDCTEVVRQ
jgi:hypothetical protein